jgi:hypothetical protein
VVLAPGGRVDCRSPTEKARRAVIPEREATLSTPKVNQLTRLGTDLPRRGAGVGCGKDDCSGSFRGPNTATVALANKLARIAWAVLRRECSFRMVPAGAA